jgi:hypothetical protein
MKVICCKNCIINPICKTGCEKLLKDSKKIIFEDFKIYENLSIRLITINQVSKKHLNLRFKHNKKVTIERIRCSFFKNGELHREDGPSLAYLGGEKYWYINGKRHREDGPAIEHPNGAKEWWVNGKHHREDGPAAEYSNGDKDWYIDGKHHREDGPAIEYANGNKEWYINGKLHREDGPAVEYINGDKEWWINGIQIKENEGNML